MNIVFSTDQTFIPHMGVTMTSILTNTARDDRIHFFVLSESLPELEKQRILSLRSIRDFDFTHISITSIDGFLHISSLDPSSTHVSIPTYFRLKIGSLLPEIDRALYLDCDTIVRGSLKDLWDLDLQGKTIAAVEDSPFLCKKYKSLPGCDKYFNSGVILFDLKQWREKDYENKAFNLDRTFLADTPFHDQDILNNILKNDVLYVENRWNFITHIFDDLSRETGQKDLPMPDPVIVHFTTNRKPWLFSTKKITFAEEYLQYRQKGPWKDVGRTTWFYQALRYCYRHPGAAILYGLKRACNILHF